MGLTNLNSGLNLTDSECDFRFIRKNTFFSAFKLAHDGFSIESEMLIDAATILVYG
jgi:hypothetical protein